MIIRVDAGLAGERADKIVAMLAEVSRSVARRLIETGAAQVDGSPVAPRDRLDVGAMVSIDLPATETLEPEEVAFEVRYEDADVAVVDKPSGIVVHPGTGVMGGTLAGGLLFRWPQIRGIGQENRWGIVHRLDRDTSGLLMVALTEAAYEGLTAAIAAHEVSRTYLALVQGGFALPGGTIDAPIGRDPRRPTRRVVRREGRPARTHYRRLAGWNDRGVSLLEVRLETGRTHQIRVHLESIGHPVIGDRVYGAPNPRMSSVERIWLHAVSLSFAHPVTGATIDVTAPLPSDLQSTLEELGSADVGGYPKNT
ncbi:MAG TPA: RluA family pseudouridine synthase [Actinobacteria bacterium]|nr:ribosomal large subunit pseudouridine synthase D [bacterium BMS3Bbin01]HDH25750.1 RluA family pseudouridine synthase [Actinomycetota bacterium]